MFGRDELRGERHRDDVRKQKINGRCTDKVMLTGEDGRQDRQFARFWARKRIKLDVAMDLIEMDASRRSPTNSTRHKQGTKFADPRFETTSLETRLEIIETINVFVSQDWSKKRVSIFIDIVVAAGKRRRVHSKSNQQHNKNRKTPMIVLPSEVKANDCKGDLEANIEPTGSNGKPNGIGAKMEPSNVDIGIKNPTTAGANLASMAVNQSALSMDPETSGGLFSVAGGECSDTSIGAPETLLPKPETNKLSAFQNESLGKTPLFRFRWDIH